MRNTLSLFLPIAFPFLLTSATIAPFVWQHHDLHADSPTFRSAAQMDAWVRRTSDSHVGRCLPGSEVVKRIDEGEHVGQYAQFRCRTEHSYWRIAALFGLPMLLAWAMAMRLRSRRAKG